MYRLTRRPKENLPSFPEPEPEGIRRNALVLPEIGTDLVEIIAQILDIEKAAVMLSLIDEISQLRSDGIPDLKLRK